MRAHARHSPRPIHIFAVIENCDQKSQTDGRTDADASIAHQTSRRHLIVQVRLARVAEVRLSVHSPLGPFPLWEDNEMGAPITEGFTITVTARPRPPDERSDQQTAAAKSTAIKVIKFI